MKLDLPTFGHPQSMIVGAFGSIRGIRANFCRTSSSQVIALAFFLIIVHMLQNNNYICNQALLSICLSKTLQKLFSFNININSQLQCQCLISKASTDGAPHPNCQHPENHFATRQPKKTSSLIQRTIRHIQLSTQRQNLGPATKKLVHYRTVQVLRVTIKRQLDEW